MAQDTYEFDPVPSYNKPTHEYGTPFGDEFHAERVAELLASTAAFTQRGVTLAGGQGVLPTGCVLAQQTSSGLYFAYNSSASDGTQTPLGVLRDARDTGGASSPSGLVATPCQGNLVIRGILNLSLVSGTDTASIISSAGGGIGSGASGAATQLKARIDPVNGYFIF